jgi:hypothetical protein
MRTPAEEDQIARAGATKKTISHVFLKAIRASGGFH